MKKVFALFGTIALEGISGINKQLSDIDKGFKEFSKGMAKTGRDLDRLGTKTFTVGFAPIVAAAGALMLMSKKTGEFADKIFDLKEITGISTDSLQKWKYAVEAAGGDFDGFTKSIPQFTNRLPEIIKGGNASSQAFSKLGVSLRDSGGNVRDMNELFPEMIYALQGIENVAERNALAQDLFGRSLQELGPVLGMTKEQLNALFKESEALGIVLSEDDLTAADDFRKTLVTLEKVFASLGQRLAISFIPVFKDVIHPLFVNSVIPAIKDLAAKVKSGFEWFNRLDPAVKENAVKFIAITAAIGPFLIIVGKALTAVAGLRTMVLLLNAALLSNPYVLVTASVVGFVAALIAARDNTKKLHAELSSKNTERLKNSLTELIYNYKLLANIDKEPIDEETYRRATEDVAKLKQNISDLGVNFSGNFRNDVQIAINKLNELNGVAEEFEPTVITGSTSVSSEEEIAAAKKAADEKEKLIRKQIISIREQQADARTALEETAEHDASVREKMFREDQEAADRMIDLKIKGEEELLRVKKENAEKEKKLHQDIYQSSLEGLSSVINTFQLAHDNRVAALDIEEEAERDKIQKSTASESEKQEKLDALNEKYAKKKRELARRQAILDKVSAIFQIQINAAAAMMKAWADVGFPGAIALTIVIGALSTIATAMVASKPLPAAARGLFVRGNRGGIPVEVGEANQDEIILPMKTGVAAVAEALLERISRAASTVSAGFATVGRSPMLATAGVGAYGAVGNETHWHIHAQNIIADNHGLKELERTLHGIRMSEATRKGGQ
jgi:gas vesicle protein